MTYPSRSPDQPGPVMLSIFGAAALGLAAMLALRAPATAQEFCMDRAQLTTLLGERYAERNVARGLSSSGQMVEVYASGDGATWTMVMTTPDGRSCVVASGEAWAGVQPPKIPDQAV